MGLGNGWMFYVDVVCWLVFNYIEMGFLYFFDLVLVVMDEECC